MAIIASDTLGCVSIDLLVQYVGGLHRFRIWMQLGSIIATDLCLMQCHVAME